MKINFKSISWANLKYYCCRLSISKFGSSVVVIGASIFLAGLTWNGGVVQSDIGSWISILSYAGNLTQITRVYATDAIPSNITNVETLTQTICKVLDAGFKILVTLVVALVLYAAFLYLSAGENAEQVKKASKTLTYAAVAIFVALVAKAFPTIVGELLGIESIKGCTTATNLTPVTTWIFVALVTKGFPTIVGELLGTPSMTRCSSAAGGESSPPPAPQR